MSTLVYCIWPSLSQVEFNKVAVCQAHQSRATLTQSLPCLVSWMKSCIDTSLQSIGEKKWSEGGRSFIHRTVILHHFYRLCCCTLTLLLENAHGVKGLKNMVHLFQKRNAMWNYDLQISRHYTYFAMESRKQKHPGKVCHLCLPFDCIFHFEPWTALPLI